MIYVFLGKEINVIKNKINKLILELGISNIIRYDYSDIDFIDIINEVNYVDLFNEKKLIIVNSFSFKKLSEKDEKYFIDYINHMNDNVIIFNSSDESLDKRKSLISLLYDKCSVVECSKLSFNELVDYIYSMLNEKKVKYKDYQVKKIINLCENNADRCINEINKLLLYIENNEIRDSDIEDVMSMSFDNELFRLVDAVVLEDKKSVFNIYFDLVNHKVEPTIIISSIADRYRLMLQIKLLEKNNSMKNIAIKFGYGNRIWAFEKIFNACGNYSTSRICDVIDLLHKTDIELKSNDDKYRILEKFLINL